METIITMQCQGILVSSGQRVRIEASRKRKRDRVSAMTQAELLDSALPAAAHGLPRYESHFPFKLV